jgi:hypothetical protein
MEIDAGNWLEKGSRLFFEFGPFFITLLIMLVFLRSASRELSDAVAKNAPQQEVRFRRLVYGGIWLFAGTLILISVAWWLWRKEQEANTQYVVRFDISDAQPTDVLAPASDDFYYSNRDVTDADRRRDTFVAISEKPFKPMQQFVIVHKKGFDAERGFKYLVTIDKDVLKERRASYRLVLRDGNYELAPIQSSHASVDQDWQLIGVAFAGEAISRPNIPAQQWTPPPKSMPPQSQGLPRNSQAADAELAVRVLLNEKSSVARLIDALDILSGEVRNGRRINLLQTRAASGSDGEESLLSYLLTLSHHEDRLLAFKSKDLLERTDYIRIIVKAASGETGVAPSVERRILASLSPSDWTAVEGRMKTDRISVPASKVESRSAKGAAPIPSATEEGTQYYSLTSWGKLTTDQAKCLAGVIYRESDDPRTTLASAEGFVESRNGYALSFKTKSEAIVYAGLASKCGAKTEFVYRRDKRLSEFLQ